MKRKIKYIFCINTGRSGSHYLSSIFNMVDNCDSQHEMTPRGNCGEMRRFLRGLPDGMRALSDKKLLQIEESLKSHELFSDTSHLFIKGFGWFFAELLPNEEIGIIILDREKSKITKSYERVGCVALEQKGRNWIATPEMRNTLVKAPTVLGLPPHHGYKLMLAFNKTFKFISKILNHCKIPAPESLKVFKQYNIDCLDWYYDETSAQGKKFREKYPNMHYYETTVDDLNSEASVQRLFDFFGLTSSKNLLDIIGKPTNLKKTKKKPTSLN